jgi:hypothetical protein
MYHCSVVNLNAANCRKLVPAIQRSHCHHCIAFCSVSYYLWERGAPWVCLFFSWKILYIDFSLPVLVLIPLDSVLRLLIIFRVQPLEYSQVFCYAIWTVCVGRQLQKIQVSTCGRSQFWLMDHLVWFLLQSLLGYCSLLCLLSGLFVLILWVFWARCLMTSLLKRKGKLLYSRS